MSISRRKIIQGGAAIAAVSTAPLPLVFAQSAEFTYKYAHNVPTTHPMHIRAKAAADAIRAETQGRLDIQVFQATNSVEHRHVQPAALQWHRALFTLSGLILSLCSTTALNGVGSRITRPCGGRWTVILARTYAARSPGQPRGNGQALGQRFPPRLDQAYHGPDDLRGLKIRVPVSPMWTHPCSKRSTRRPRR
jgi:hypothetical protein